MALPTFARVALGFAVLAVVLGLVERRWPAVPGQRLLRRGFATDVAYWFFTPLVTRAVTRLALGAALVVGALLAGLSPERERLAALVQGSPGWRDLPTAVQALAVLVVGDLAGYWMHRAFHHARLWRFHAPHHSSRDLDWLSAVRLHPVNDVLARLAQALPLLLLGLPAASVATYAPLLGLYAIGLHANVPWTFGPLRFVLASPAFHRWHHACEDEGRARNFAGFLPLWDVLFGTFDMPAGPPRRCGVREPLPESFFGQLLHPWRRASLPDGSGRA